MSTIMLTEEQIEAIADAVAARIIPALVPPTTGLVTVAELAPMLGVKPAFLYAHATELGAIRLGDGPKAPLRFDSAVARAALHTESAPAQPSRTSSPRSRRRASTAGSILRVRPAQSLNNKPGGSRGLKEKQDD